MRAADSEFVDLEAVYRIKAEGFERSQVMEIAAGLTDLHGPRLTGSPTARAAGVYARDLMKEWGMVNARLEPWHFGRGWSNQLFWARMVTPHPFMLTGYPRAWSPGTPGTVRASAILLTATTEKELQEYRGRLSGRIVLVGAEPEREAKQEPVRFSDHDLEELSRQPNPSKLRMPRLTPAERTFIIARDKFLFDEAVAAVVEPSRQIGNGAVLVARSGARLDSDPPVPPIAILSSDHYGRITRLLQRSIPVEIELAIENRYHDDQADSFNVVAEIRGADSANEVVMLGAHLDSWHSGTGATDNAAGCAVMMEAMRILRQSGVKLRRTVRIGLWMGEEQGLLGSKAYVARHLMSGDGKSRNAEHARFSTYFNLDAGTGAIRGVYLQGNELVAPIFAAWMEPFQNMGMSTVAIRPGGPGGSDQTSFDAVGLPAFQFIQDPLGYESWTHHANSDVFERLDARDLMQNAVIVASFAYHAANRNSPLPRKPNVPSDAR